MGATPCLVLYGNSIFMAGIQAELRLRTALKLVTIEAGCRDAADIIRSQVPIAVIFDLACAQPDFAISLLQDQPGLLLVGVNPSSDKMLLLSSQYATALSMMDLMEIVGRQGRGSPKFMGSPL